MHVLFLARIADIFSPLTLQTKSLGGTESCVYYLAQALAKLGHQVTVINNCRADAGFYDGVQYRDYHPRRGLWETIEYARQNPVDFLIIVRDFAAPIFPIPAKQTLFWAHDDFSALGIYPEQANGWKKTGGKLVLRLLGLLFHRINRVITVSEWQAEPFIQGMGLPPEKIIVSPNGIDLDLFDVEHWSKYPGRIIYSSRPERGLEVLLSQIFPKVKQACPEAELHIFSYVDLTDYHHWQGNGIIFRGQASKAQLAQELMQAEIWVLPQLPHEPSPQAMYSFNAETFCIGAAESQCARTVPISSWRGALPETTIPGQTSILVNWEYPITDKFIHDFAQAMIELLQNPQKRQAMGQAGRDFARSRFDWHQIAINLMTQIQT